MGDDTGVGRRRLSRHIFQHFLTSTVSGQEREGDLLFWLFSPLSISRCY